MHCNFWYTGKKKAAMQLIDTGLELAHHLGYVKSFDYQSGKQGDCLQINPNTSTLWPDSKKRMKKTEEELPW